MLVETFVDTVLELLLDIAIAHVPHLLRVLFFTHALAEHESVLRIDEELVVGVAD